jgi:hypothetical protein
VFNNGAVNTAKNPDDPTPLEALLADVGRAQHGDGITDDVAVRIGRDTGRSGAFSSVISRSCTPRRTFYRPDR